MVKSNTFCYREVFLRFMFFIGGTNGGAGHHGNIQTPSGSVPINSYVFDADNVNKFMANKQSNYMSGTEMFNTTQGEVQVLNLRSGTYYVGLQNLSGASAALVKIEVVAIVLQ